MLEKTFSDSQGMMLSITLQLGLRCETL